MSKIEIAEHEKEGYLSVTVGTVGPLKVNPTSTTVPQQCRRLGVTTEQFDRAVAEWRAQQAGAPSGGFSIVSRTMDAEDSYEVQGDHPLEALDDAIREAPAVRFLTWPGERDDLCALDVDLAPGKTSEGVNPLRLAERCGAERAWFTKSGGARLMFVRDFYCTALERAVAAAYLLGIGRNPNVARVEFLERTRTPPRGETVHHIPQAFEQNGVAWTIANAQGVETADEDQAAVDEWLAARGLQAGQRYEHNHCPFDPSAKDARRPVVVFEDRIHCYVCAATGEGGTKTIAELATGRRVEVHPLAAAARELVPWAQVKAALADGWPDSMPEWTQPVLYRAVLKALHRDEGQLGSVFDPNFVWLRTESGHWVHRDTLKPVKLTNALARMSWTGGHPARVDQAKNTERLAGFVPVRPVSCLLCPELVPEDVAPLVRDPSIRPFRPDYMEWDRAFEILQADLPGMPEVYLKAVLLACVCAEPGADIVGLLACGPSGAGKTTVPLFVSTLLGTQLAQVSVLQEEEAFKRSLGEVVSYGQRPILLDEVDKIDVRKERHKILSLHSPLRFRPLYQEWGYVTFTAPLIAAGIRVPHVFSTREMGRRFRAVELRETVEWDVAYVTEWRERGKEIGVDHDVVGDSLVRWAIDEGRKHGYNWRRAADSLELPTADQLDAGRAAAVLNLQRDLYRYCRGELGPRHPSTLIAYPASQGWLHLDDEVVARIVDEPIQIVYPAAHSPLTLLNKDLLEAADWRKVLGVPGIRFEGHVIGQAPDRWIGRFLGGPSGPYNEELPELQS